MRTRGGGGRTDLAVSHTKLKQEVWSCVRCFKESTQSVDNLYKYLKIKDIFYGLTNSPSTFAICLVEPRIALVAEPLLATTLSPALQKTIKS